MLAQIVADKKLRLAEDKRKLPLMALREKLPSAPALRQFAGALDAPGISLIAEIKKASPSRGSLGMTVPAAELAAHYEEGGARAISVLTEEDHFQGSLADLIAVRRAVRLPVLRKDFIIDEWQLYETRLLPADAVLLIAGLLPEATLAEFLKICDRLGLAALVEIHSAEEVRCALRVGAKIIGINNRDLQSFKTDIRHTERLASLVSDNVLLVSESGIMTADDVRLAAAAGADAVLVGEALVRAADPSGKIRNLLGR